MSVAVQCPKRLTFLLGGLEYKELLLLVILLFAFKHGYKLPVIVFFQEKNLEFLWIEKNTGIGDLADDLCIPQLNIFTHF